MTDAPRLSRGKTAVFATIAVLVFTVGTVVLLEGAASNYIFVRDYLGARAPAHPARPTTVHDTLLGWRHRPGYVGRDEYGPGIALTLDGNGFRRGPARGDSAGVRARVVCSGDESTLGVGVADDRGWCALLERELPGVETVNMGAESYGLDQSVLRYRRDGASLAPRVHVLAITQAALRRSVRGDLDGWFKPLLSLNGSRIVVRNVPVPPQTGAALRAVARAHVVDELRAVQLYRRLRGFDRESEISDASDARLPLFETLLADVAAAERAHGGKLVVVYLPTLREVRRDDDARRRDLAAWTRDHAIAFIDLTLAMHAMRADSLDLAYISHVLPGARPTMVGQYSNLGHAWIARMIASRLTMLGALDDSSGTGRKLASVAGMSSGH